ncbi:MAG: hypothetical protein E7509_00155 [Ruminococcus sp.]|nr:hypothetical protein [Ruminococcus sp.]
MKRIISAFVATVMLAVGCLCVSAEENIVNTTLNGLFQNENGKILFDDDFLKNVGTTSSDWYVIALRINNIDAEYEKYLDALTVYVSEKYETENRLHKVKATEWHRIALAVEACGGNAENFNGINLIADGIYNFDLDKQGINAYIWALICLSADDYKTPSDALNTKENIIDEILLYQLYDGGFALSGDVGDVDVTANVITALAPYKDDEKVSEAVDRAVSFLKSKKLPDSGFESYGVKNCESACQALVAFYAVGEDTEGIAENVFSFKTQDGFSHLADGETSYLATQQAILALGAVNKNRYVYDFSEVETIIKNEVSQYDRERIQGFSENVNAVDVPTIKRLLQTVEEINPDDATELKDVLNNALSEAYYIKRRIDSINVEISKISRKGLKVSHRETIEELFDKCEDLSEEDMKLVTEYDELLKLDAEMDSLLRRDMIFNIVFICLVGCLTYFRSKRRKQREQDM